MNEMYICMSAAIHEFPEDVFTKEQRKKGAVFLHALCVSVYLNIIILIFTSDVVIIRNHRVLRPSTCSTPSPSSVTITSSLLWRRSLR